MVDVLVAVQPADAGPRAGLSGAEARVADLLRSWVGAYAMSGVAFANVSVPHSHAGRRQVDAVVFTPAGIVVVEVEGFHTPQTGALACPLNGSWTVDGQPVLLHTQSSANPWQQLDVNLYAVKNALTDRGLDPGFVSGLIVVVPQRRGDITLPRRRPGGRGTQVVLADQEQLRRFFHQLARRRAHWTAPRVLAAARALDLGDYAPTPEELSADGFADAATTLHRSAASTSTPAPSLETTTPDAASTPEEHDEPRTPPGGTALPAATRTSPWRTAVTIVAVLVALVALIALAVFVHGVFH